MRAFPLLLLLLALGACSTPCEELAAKICDCEATRSERDACRRRAAQNQSTVTDTDQTLCNDKLDGCDCNALNTAAGKRACGLAP